MVRDRSEFYQIKSIRVADFIVSIIFLFVGSSSSLSIGVEQPPKNEYSVEVPCRYLLPGDLNGDCKVDMVDVSIIAVNWLIDCNELPLNPACFDNATYVQKVQFHAIEVGLEMFKSEYGSYPRSSDNETESFDSLLGDDPNTYLGANKLAEAIVGMDLMGFHPHTALRSDGLNVFWDDGWVVRPVYTDAPENLDERDGPFLDLEYSNAYRLEDIYEDVGSFNGSTLVLCDVFEKERYSGKKTGMPILYFRPRNYIEQDYTDGIENDIYYYPDNQALLQLGSAEDQTISHPLSDGENDWQDFENMILNPNITVIKRPYRADTYLLISAGLDGLYGTEDDIFNFDPFIPMP